MPLRGDGIGGQAVGMFGFGVRDFGLCAENGEKTIDFFWDAW